MTQKLLLAIPAALSLAACGGGGDDDVTTVPAQAQYSDPRARQPHCPQSPTYAGRDKVTSSRELEFKQWNSRWGHDQSTPITTSSITGSCNARWPHFVRDHHR